MYICSFHKLQKLATFFTLIYICGTNVHKMYKMFETSDSLCSTLQSEKIDVCNCQNQLFRKNGLSYKSCCGLHESRILLEGKSSISNNLSQYLLYVIFIVRKVMYSTS